jgi:hypothetical protein
VITATSATPTPSAEPAVATRPISAFPIDCADVVSDETVSATVGEHDPVVQHQLPRVSTISMAEVAVEQDGGLWCEWHRPIESGDQRIALRIIAIPDAAADFGRIRPSLMKPADLFAARFAHVEAFDDTFIRCDESTLSDPSTPAETRNVVGCSWHVLAGNTWLAVDVDGVPSSDYRVPVPRNNPDTSAKPLVPVVDGSASLALITTVVSSLESVSRDIPDTSQPAMPDCPALIDRKRVQSSLSMKIKAIKPAASAVHPSASTNVSEALAAYSAERVGNRRCAVSENRGFGSWTALVTVARSAPWLADELTMNADASMVSAVEGLGTVIADCSDGADEFEGYPTCYMAVLGSGGDVVYVFIADSDDPLIGIEIARSALLTLGS